MTFLALFFFVWEFFTLILYIFYLISDFFQCCVCMCFSHQFFLSVITIILIIIPLFSKNRERSCGLNGRVGENIGGDEGNEILIKMKCIKIILNKINKQIE